MCAWNDDQPELAQIGFVLFMGRKPGTARIRVLIIHIHANNTHTRCSWSRDQWELHTRPWIHEKNWSSNTSTLLIDNYAYIYCYSQEYQRKCWNLWTWMWIFILNLSKAKLIDFLINQNLSTTVKLFCKHYNHTILNIFWKRIFPKLGFVQELQWYFSVFFNSFQERHLVAIFANILIDLSLDLSQLSMQCNASIVEYSKLHFFSLDLENSFSISHSRLETWDR